MTLLVFVSAAAAVLYLLSSLIQLLRGRARAGFWGTFFAFMIVICALVGFYETPATLTLIRVVALGVAAAMIAANFVFLLFEFRLKPRAMKTSRAALGLGAGLLILAGVVAAPYVKEAIAARATTAATQALGGQGGPQNVSRQVGAGGPAGQFGQPGGTQEAAPDVTAEAGQGGGGQGRRPPGATEEAGSPAATDQPPSGAPGPAAAALESETGLSADEIMTRLNSGETMAALVQAHGGDLDKVKTALTDGIRQTAQAAIDAGTLPQAQADRMLGGLDQLVERAVQGELQQPMFERIIAPAITGGPISFGGGQGGGGQDGGFGRQPDANATADVGADGTTEAQPGDGAQAASGGTGFGGQGGGFAAQQQPTVPPTVTPTAFPTSTPLPPRPTLPSPTPTNTPFVIATSTPATGTPAAPTSGASASGGVSSAAPQCTGYPNHNVNLRTGPSIDTERQLTIPASSMLAVTGRNADTTWLFVTYQDKTGWVDAQYIDQVGKCDTLPDTSQ